MMNNLDMILEVLQDSEWHEIEEIRKEIPIPEDELSELISFMQVQGFLLQEKEKLKIKSRGLKVLTLPRLNRAAKK